MVAMNEAAKASLDWLDLKRMRLQRIEQYELRMLALVDDGELERAACVAQCVLALRSGL